MFRKVVVVFSILLFGMICFAQSSGQSYNDLLKTAKQGDSKAQALVAYYLKEGIGVKKDLKEAKKWAQTASELQNGFAYWLLAQIATDMGDDPLSYRQYLESALSCDYPLAISLFARLYDSGSPQFGIERDSDKAFDLFHKSADNGDTEAAAYLGYQYLKKKNDPLNAFKYFSLAASNGDAESMSMVASMYANGVGTVKNMTSAYDWYKRAADSASPSGLEGLADCFRTGQGTSSNQPEAFRTYSKITSFSSRLQYILGYYYAMGEGVDQDVAMAVSLLKQSAASGNVYAQAVLGVAQYEGDVPFKDEKDVGKALPFLKSAFENSGRESLPAGLLQKVYRYLSGFYRYGRVVDRDMQLAEQLTSKADAMQFDAKTALHPFAYVGMRSVEECLESYPLKPLASPESFINQVVFDYPVPKGIVPSSGHQDIISTSSKNTKKTESHLAIIIEASPYGLGPVSSEQIKGGWLRDHVSEVAVSIGHLGESGLFLGGGIGYDSYSSKKLSVLNGFLDARYLMNPQNRIIPYIEGRGGIAYEMSKIGIGMQFGAGVGVQIKVQESFLISIGAKAAFTSFFNEAATKCGAVMPTIGISF